MKALVMCLALMLIAPFVFADNFFDDATDVLKGRNEDFPTTLYVAYTTKGNLPLIPANLRIKLESRYGENFGKQGEVSIGLEF